MNMSSQTISNIESGRVPEQTAWTVRITHALILASRDQEMLDPSLAGHIGRLKYHPDKIWSGYEKM